MTRPPEGVEPPVEESRVYGWLKQLAEEMRTRVPPHRKHGNFSKPAIQEVGQLLSEKLKNLDPTLDSKSDVHIEGHPAHWVNKKRVFLRSRCYPDLGLRLGLQSGDKRVAIEVDHGWTGAQVRNALTKGSFNVAVGDWHECVVLFFDETGGKLARGAEGETEARILHDYRQRYRTHLVFIPFRKG